MTTGWNGGQINRRGVLKASAAAAAGAVLPNALAGGRAEAAASDTLVIAAPATPSPPISFRDAALTR